MTSLWSMKRACLRIFIHTYMYIWMVIKYYPRIWIKSLRMLVFMVVTQMVNNLSSELQCRGLGFNPCFWKIPWRRKWQPTPAFLPGKSHRQRSLVGYSARGHKESDTTKPLTLSLFPWAHIYKKCMRTEIHVCMHMNEHICMWVWIHIVEWQFMFCLNLYMSKHVGGT